jgi:hypothetical protein
MLVDMTKPSSEAIWLERVLAWRQDGRSAAHYCEDKPYHPSSLLSWSSRLGQEGKVQPLTTRRKRAFETVSSATFARIVARPTPQPSAAVVVAVGASRIEVAEGFDPGLLRSVVSALAGGGQ